MNIKKLVALFSAITLISLTMSFPVFAKNIDNHVFNSLNNKGDALIFPAYFALDGVNTNLTVINSSNSHAVVAKVVVRSFAFSTELLDFFIFLTPNDVWKGELRYANGNVVMYSEDSSVWNPATGECASDTDPFEYSLAPVKCADVDSATIGYVEVFEAVATPWETPDPHHCRDLRDWFESMDVVIAPEETLDCLTGYGEYVFPGDYAVFPATILANYNVVNKLTIGQETLWGAGADNTIAEVEAALAKDHLILPYYNGKNDVTLALITFPTKLTSVNLACDVLGVLSPFFKQNGQDCLYLAPFSYDAYDLSENAISECQVSPCITGAYFPWELNWFTPNDLGISFDAGWIRISFDTTTVGADRDKNDITYSGAPVIGMVVHLTQNGLSVGDIAYDYGVVNGETTGAYQKGCADVVCPACDSCCDPCDPCPDQCDADHPDLCLCEAACVDAGLNWCDNACQVAECGAAACDADHLDLCDTQTACEFAGLHWCDNACQVAECGGGGLPSCDADHLYLCDTEPECTDASGYWCDDACQATECGSGPSTIIGGETVTCATTCFGNWTNPNFVQECDTWQNANCQ